MWLEEHLRHSRGYGIHSPFLYHIVREAMMPRRVTGSERGLYEALLGRGVSKRTARRLQNLHTLEQYEDWSIDRTQGIEGRVFVVLTEGCDRGGIGAIQRALRERGGVVVVLHEGCCRRQRALRNTLVKEHHSMSAEKRGFTLLFSREDLRKQHIII